MKILVIARGRPSAVDPQEGCFEWDQIRALKAIGHQPIVLALDARIRRNGHKYGIHRYDVDGIPFYQGYWMTVSIIERVINRRLAYKLYRHFISKILKRVVAEHPDIDIVNAHFLFSAYNILPAVKEARLPLVATEHWSVLEKDKLDNFIRHLGDEVYHNVDKVIAVSQSLRDRIKQHFGVDSVVVHNMIGTEFENANPALRPYAEREGEKFRFVCTGSLIPRKGFDVAIRAFKEAGLREKATLSIIGGGPLREELQKLIDRLGLTDSVTLLGKKQKEEIVEILSDAHAFILPSRAENFSVAILEALALGLPAIATICGGIRECIDKYNGVLVEVDDVNEMALAMREMIANYETYDRQTIRDNALVKYGPTTIAESLVTVFKSELRHK